ncbi:hypothetical protein [Cupriavidus sp. BIC8F]|uniref:hypothetical protein n=1 Tax=Cupriavidus sp. BIC8F TaxID=3079014 RepID=UPI0029163DFA|nr:hypothetical protein [Cupriavidus sp. BIC8F]
MSQPTFGQLLYTLFSRGVVLARKTPAQQNEPITPTSIRLPPHVRRFYEAQAEALGGISFQAAITMALTGLAEASVADEPYHDPAHAARTIQERFFLLFKEHRIDLIEIPSILERSGFTPSSLTQPDRLLDLLRPSVIAWLAETMGIRADWLKGTSPFPAEDKFNWYKYVPNAIRRLSSLVLAGNRVDVLFVRRAGADFAAALAGGDANSDREPVGVVLRIYRKTADQVSYTTYEKWAFERWNYERCRQQLKLLMTFCDQAMAHHIPGLSCAGLELPADIFDQLDHDKCLPVTAFTSWRNGAIWHPEDYGSLRDKWVTEERDDFRLNVLPEYTSSNLDRFLAPEYWRAASSR